MRARPAGHTHFAMMAATVHYRLTLYHPIGPGSTGTLMQRGRMRTARIKLHGTVTPAELAAALSIYYTTLLQSGKMDAYPSLWADPSNARLVASVKRVALKPLQ